MMSNQARQHRKRVTRLLVLAAAAAAIALLALTVRTVLTPRGGANRGATAGLEAVVEEVEEGRTTTPLVGEPAADGTRRATFLAKSVDGKSPRVVSDVTGWGEHIDGTFDFSAGTMKRVGLTDWYSLETVVAPHARVEYLIAYDVTDYRLDPHNPRRAAQEASEFVMPDYVPPEELVARPSPGGRLHEAVIESRVLGESRRLVVYTPPGYREGGTYPLAVFLDLRAAQMSPVVDWLIARGEINPIVAVFEGPALQGTNRPPDEQVRAYLTGELLALVRSRYPVGSSADQRAIIAISFGAKDALDAALDSSRAFGRLGLLIPGRRITPAAIDAIPSPPTSRLHVAILAGLYDHANVPTARALRHALSAAGHDVHYNEVPEGHSSRTFLNHLRVVLVSLFGPANGTGS